MILDVETLKNDSLEISFIDQRLLGGLVSENLVETGDGGPGGFSTERQLIVNPLQCRPHRQIPALSAF